jgi:hypothetical protein
MPRSIQQERAELKQALNKMKRKEVEWAKEKQELEADARKANQQMSIWRLKFQRLSEMLKTKAIRKDDEGLFYILAVCPKCQGEVRKRITNESGGDSKVPNSGM